MGRFEQYLKTKKCPKCKQATLIPKTPRIYNRIRCVNCGATGRIKVADVSEN
jgi:ribosomal protein S27E